MAKLLQINVTANTASSGRLCEDIGDVVMTQGWESYVAFGRDSRPSSSNLIKIGNKFDFYAHLIKSVVLDRHGFGSRIATKQLIDKINEINPDIIQLHNIHGYFLNIELVFSYIAERDIPVVWSLHDCWSITGHCAHFALVGCEKWKNGCYSCPNLSDYPRSFGWDSSKRNYLQKKKLIESVPRLSIISGSEWIAGIARESYLGKRDIFVIPDGIDTNIYSPQENTEWLREKYGLVGKFVIMACGTAWPEYKGISDYAKLKNMLPDNFAIILVGLSPSDIVKLPKGLIGIPKTKSPQELATYYSMADCVMSLSRLESFGLTPVEGFACGTPAIVYDNCALSELITPETGFKIEPGNIEELYESVIEMSKIGKSSFSENCRKVAVEKYDRFKCYKDYLTIYENLINS